MSNTDNDQKIIRRDSLLKKKRIINAIQKLKYDGPKSAVRFVTSCGYLTEAAKVFDWNHFNNLLEGIETDQIAYFKIGNGSDIDGWGSYTIEVTLGERFDQLAKEISDEYHQINLEIGRDTTAMKFEDYDLHPRVKRVAKNLFENNHYKEAILNSLIEVINRVKEVTSYPKKPNGHDRDGDDLMNYAFSSDADRHPVIKLNDFSSELDKVEQQGFMFLYKGICGIRDKKAHLNFIQDSPRITIEYLSFASLLMRLLDDDFLRQYNEPPTK